MKTLKRRKPDRSPSGRQLSRRQKNILDRKAKHRRKNMTDAEKRLAKTLGRRRVLGVKFFRHHVYDHLIVHFYSRAARLVILVRPDGMKWGWQEDVDYLERQGLSVLRFSETEILDRLEWVMSLIWGVCRDRLGYESTGHAADTGADVIAVDFGKPRETEEPDESSTAQTSDAPRQHPESPSPQIGITAATEGGLRRAVAPSDGRIGPILQALAAAAAIGVGLRIASVTRRRATG